MSPGLEQNDSIIKNIVWSIPVIQMPFQKGDFYEKSAKVFLLLPIYSLLVHSYI